MGTTYTAKLDVRCWKQHKCVSCGGGYRYYFARTKSGQGSTEAGAEQAVRQAVMTALQDEVDQQPCPECGVYQPDMVGSRRSWLHLVTLGVGAVAFLAVILLGWFLLGANVGTNLALAVGAVLMVAHFLIGRIDPNRDLQGNQALARSTISAGRMQQTGRSTQSPSDEAVAPMRPRFAALTVALFLVALLALASPELIRIVRGWTLNPTWSTLVGGPGDALTIYLPDRINCIKSYWKGKAKVEVLNATELGLAGQEVRATTNHVDWGQSIRAKSSEKNSNVRLWVTCHIPEAASWEGKKIRARIQLDVEYPTMSGGNMFDEVEKSFTHVAEYQLASAGAAKSYQKLWWAATLAGALGVLLAGYTLYFQATTLRKSAPETQVVACEEAEA